MNRSAYTLLLLIFALLTVPVLAEDDPPTRDTFELDGHRAFVLAPNQSAQTDTGKPWVWYAPTLGKRLPGPEEGWMFERLHAKGIAIAGIDVGESYGSPKGRAAFQKLYAEMTEQRGYSKTPVLLARSRGGLMLYNWAVEHPDCVAGVAGIYPVCNLLSFPGLRRAAPAYEMTAEQLEAELAKHNPIDRLEPLAKAKVPIFHIQGDRDGVVPLEKNSGLLAERYQKLGGPVEVEVIEGGGHDMKRHWFESQTLTDFMIDKALGEPAPAGR
ncbi:MAG: alpha/beta hydrolase family protein [Phycisphaeraceae bacterium]